ncbi:nuclear polyadenylated RNA-binding protein 3 [Savitreella phatthalungensis]
MAEEVSSPEPIKLENLAPVSDGEALSSVVAPLEEQADATDAARDASESAENVVQEVAAQSKSALEQNVLPSDQQPTSDEPSIAVVANDEDCEPAADIEQSQEDDAVSSVADHEASEEAVPQGAAPESENVSVPPTEPVAPESAPVMPSDQPAFDQSSDEPVVQESAPDASADALPTTEPEPASSAEAPVDVSALLSSFAATAPKPLSESETQPPAMIAPWQTAASRPAETPTIPTGPAASHVSETSPTATPSAAKDPTVVTEAIETGISAEEADRVFDAFVEEERRVTAVKAPADFPPGTRLFVGNLDGGHGSSGRRDRGGGHQANNLVSKRDVFFAFRKFGTLVAVSLKSSYGFVQFENATDCAKALSAHIEIKGRRINCEVSKPPGSARAGKADARDRSRSPGRRNRGGRGSGDDYIPDYTRDRRRDDLPVNSFGGGSGPGRMFGQSSGQPVRAQYQASPPPGSSLPSGPASSRNGGSGYGHVDPRAQSYGRGAPPPPLPPMPQVARAPTPPPVLPPMRYGREVPDVQIVVIDGDSADRGYVEWVRSVFTATPAPTSTGRLSCETFGLSTRTPPLRSLAHQWISEGVAAICFCETRLQYAGNKVDIQVFDRSRVPTSHGPQRPEQVPFDEHQSLDPPAAAQFVVSRIQRALPPPPLPPQPSYGSAGGYSQQMPSGSGGGGDAGGLAAMISRMDPSQLQQVMSVLSSQAGSNPQAPSHHQQQQGYPMQQQQQQHGYQPYPQQQQQQSQPQSQYPNPQAQIDAVMRSLGRR